MVEPIRFPDIELYRGFGAPVRSESTISGLELISGRLPEGLEGTLYRVGADRQYPSGRTDDIFIDGEGVIHMFRFDRGHVDYRNRWVRTERFKRQEAARRALFGRYRNRYTNDPSVADVSMNTANTSSMFHAGHLYALKEDGLPHLINPDTLETIGTDDFNGAIRSVSFTAHPKVDPVTDELLGFSYQAKGDGTRDIVYYLFDRDRKLQNEIWFEMPFAANVHDFAISDKWVIFSFFPLITDVEVLKKGGPFYQWHPNEQMHVAVLPRYGNAEEIRWFRGPVCSAGHMMNAFREGDLLHLDLCLYDGNCFPFFPTPEGEETEPVPPFLTRLTFDMGQPGDSFTRRRLLDIPCEMPKIDDRFHGRPYRYGYVICARSADGSSAIGRVDVTTGELDRWQPGPGDHVQEAQFVPRAPDAAADDGWLLVPVSRVAENRSDLAVLDARNLAAGPVALFKLPVRVRSTFHGTWVPASARESGHYNYKLPAG